MRILFILGLLLFIYSFIRVKKHGKKENIFLWIFISIIIGMSLNSIIIFILSYLNIESTLLIRSIIYMVISLVLIIISRKEKQKYYIDYSDLPIIFFIICVGFIVFLLRFGYDFKLDFEMNDAIVHYNNAENFYNHNMLTEKIKEDTIMYSNNYGGTSLFFSYTNMGTLFQLGDKIVGKYGLYKLFILFEMFSYVMGGILFYYLVKKNNISNKNYLLTTIFILFYMLGYPLLNLIMGFHYWHLSLLITMVILILTKLLFSLDKNKYLIVIFLSLLSFTLFITYYLFVPLVYLVIGLYILSKYKIEKEVSLKKSVIYIVLILVIPFILGMIYYFLYPYITSDSNAAEAMKIDGANYCNLIGNFIFFIPLIIWKVIEDIKKRDFNLELFGLLATFVYTIILFVLCLCGKMSSYYYHKIYMYLWLFNYVYLVKCLYESKLSIVKIYLYSYLLIVTLGIINIEEIIGNKKSDISNDKIIVYLTDIYQRNIQYIEAKDGILDNNKKEIIDYVIDNYDTFKNVRGEIPFVATYFEKQWYTQIYKLIVSNKFSRKNEYYVNNIDNIKNDDETRYIVWIYNGINMNLINIDEYDIVYQNISGCVLKKKELYEE